MALFTCSCIFAWSSWLSSFWRSDSLRLQRHRVGGDRRLGLIGRLRRLQDQRLERLDLLLHRDEAVGERLGRLRVLERLLGVARLGGVVGHEHGLTGGAVDLLQLLHRPVQPHLGLLLVGDDVGRLLLEAPVLVLRLHDRLLELDLRVGPLVERQVELGPDVLPPAPEGLEHGRDARLAGRRRRHRPVRARAATFPRGRGAATRARPRPCRRRCRAGSPRCCRTRCSESSMARATASSSWASRRRRRSSAPGPPIAVGAAESSWAWRAAAVSCRSGRVAASRPSSARTPSSSRLDAGHVELAERLVEGVAALGDAPSTRARRRRRGRPTSASRSRTGPGCVVCTARRSARGRPGPSGPGLATDRPGRGGSIALLPLLLREGDGDAHRPGRGADGGGREQRHAGQDGGRRAHAGQQDRRRRRDRVGHRPGSVAVDALDHRGTLPA